MGAMVCQTLVVVEVLRHHLEITMEAQVVQEFAFCHGEKHKKQNTCVKKIIKTYVILYNLSWYLQ